MMLPINKYIATIIGFVVLVLFMGAVPTFADAPVIKVEVYRDIDGVLEPQPGALIRWRNKGGRKSSYKADFGLNDPVKTPRRYEVTGSDGKAVFDIFQNVNRNAAYENVLEGMSDPEFPGPVRQFMQKDGKFGCGQEDHRMAVLLEGWECTKMLKPEDDGKWQDTTCGNGWCEGPFVFQDCSNGCPEFTLKFKCERTKEQSLENLEENPKSEQLGFVDNEEGTWGFACTQTRVCNEKGLMTPTVGAQQFAQCSSEPEIGSGSKRVLISNIKRLYDRSYAQKESEKIPAYLVECFVTGEAYQCTTGSPDNDSQIFGQSNVPSGYAMKIFPKGSNDENERIDNGFTYQDIPDEIEVETSRAASASQEFDSVFMLVFNRDKAGDFLIGGNTSQQQATLSNDAGCQMVHDPFGRVFDSYTLEPLEGAEVVLNKKDENGSFRQVKQSDVSDAPGVGDIINPQTTDVDGLFSFFVPDGTYRLKVAQEGYVFPADLSNMNPAHTFMYRNIYRGDDIIQQGRLEHRDIPVDPLNEQASLAYADNNPVRIVNHFQSISQGDSVYQVEGRVSHPKASVSLVAYKSRRGGQETFEESRTLAQVESDMFGYFKILVPMNKLKEGEVIGELELKKKKVYNSQRIEPVSVQINPVLSEISGFAVSEDNAIIPGARVRVMVSKSKVPVYETTADEKGYFQVPQESTPKIPYTLVYESLGKSESQTTTSQFIARNAMVDSESYIASANNKAVLGIDDFADEENRSILILVGIIIAIFALLVVSSIFFSHSALKKTRSQS
ncbi:MAG: carboxypeptidase-like regulatory domain-containing protein [Patescibacteria group bacterium]